MSEVTLPTIINAEPLHLRPRTPNPLLHIRNPQTFFFFFTLVAGPRRSLSETRVYEPQIRARSPLAPKFNLKLSGHTRGAFLHYHQR